MTCQRASRSRPGVRQGLARARSNRSLMARRAYLACAVEAPPTTRTRLGVARDRRDDATLMHFAGSAPFRTTCVHLDRPERRVYINAEAR